MTLGRALWLRYLSHRDWQSAARWPTVLAYAAASTATLLLCASLLVPPSHPEPSIRKLSLDYADGANQASVPTIATDHSSAGEIIARGTIRSPHSFDWNRALNIPDLNADPNGFKAEPPQSIPSGSGQVLPMSPLFLAALETLAQCMAYSIMYLAARHRARHGSSSTPPAARDTVHLQQPGDSPSVYALLAPPMCAWITACSSYAVAAVATGTSAPLAPVLAMRAGALVLVFVSACSLTTMQRARQQNFAGVASGVGAVSMVIAGICGIPWLNNVDIKQVSPLGMSVLAVVSAMGPWISHEMSSRAGSEDAANGQDGMTTRAKHAFLASALLFNAAHAYDGNRIASHAIFTLPALSFLALSSLATVLSSRIHDKRDTTRDNVLSAMATGFAPELFRDLCLFLLASLVPSASIASLDWSPSSFKVTYGAVSLCAIALFSTHAQVAAIVLTRPGRSEKTPTPAGMLEKEEGLPTTGKEASASAPGAMFRGFNLANRMVRALVVQCALLVFFIGFGHITPAPKPVLTSAAFPLLPSTAATSAPSIGQDSDSSTQVDDPQYNITLTLVVDRSLPAPISAKNRTARPFLITATSKTLPSSSPWINSSLHWTASIPPASTWPLREFDLPPHPRSKDLQLKDLVFSAGGNPVGIQRSATACHTFGQLPGLDYRVVWVAEDDPAAMHGKRTFMMESFKSVCGKYPVVMYGEPNRLDRTMHRKWFKQIAYLYTTAPNTTKWFIQGDDDTFWFPDVLMAHLRSLDADPLVDSLYLGDICESVRQVRFGGVLAYGGGGMAISRALAARIAANYQYCIKVREQDFVGDIMMMQCIEDLTRVDGKGKNVTLTRVPIFNQLDLMEWDWAKGAREYLSLHMSQVAPATLHHIEYMRPLVGGSPVKFMAMYDLWHMMTPIPPRLRFRRFMVNVVGAGTAVITFGYHVRIYDRRLQLGIEHHVDFDSTLSRDPEWLRIEVPLDDDKYAGTTEDQWPERRLDYRDFWIYEYDAERDAMVYIHEETRDKFALACTTADGVKVGSVRTMCGTVKEVTEFVEDAEMFESFLEK